MKCRFGRRNGQTMVEYIIIVVLIAITLLVLFSRLSKATGRKIAGATSALDADAGSEAEALANDIDENTIKKLNTDGSFQQ
jgi:Flp pilus assembly pilin Flp